MIQDDETLLIERKLVVVFDICSSTTILEDLKRTDNLAQWRNFITFLKRLLSIHENELGLVAYNFIGDGWVLLFPEAISTDKLCDFLRVISKVFSEEFERSIRPLLSHEPVPNGLMFGIDAGELIRLQMNEQDEYLGRAINVAARLQGYTRELQSGPSYKAIFSANSFNRPSVPPPPVAVERLKVTLRNITPPIIECFVVQTFRPPEKVVVRKRGSGMRADKKSQKKTAKPDAVKSELARCLVGLTLDAVYIYQLRKYEGHWQKRMNFPGRQEIVMAPHYTPIPDHAHVIIDLVFFNKGDLATTLWDFSASMGVGTKTFKGEFRPEVTDCYIKKEAIAGQPLTLSEYTQPSVDLEITSANPLARIGPRHCWVHFTFKGLHPDAYQNQIIDLKFRDATQKREYLIEANFILTEVHQTS